MLMKTSLLDFSKRSSPPSYKCILADPPWNERGGIKKGAQRHYPLLKTPEIIEVMRAAPVWRPDPDGSLLWLWATSNFLPDAIRVMEALEFKYITSLVWVKTGQPGLGQRTRQQHELLLLGRMGSVPVPAPANRPNSVIEAPRRRHSEKPERVYELIEKACEGPRVELFCRKPRDGWTVWGNEIEGYEPCLTSQKALLSKTTGA